MRAQPGTRTRVGVALLVSGLLALVSAPATAQDDDLCGTLTPDDIAAVVPGTYGPPGTFGACSWHGTTSGGEEVEVGLFAADSSALSMTPGAEEMTIDGRQAVSLPPMGPTSVGVAVAIEGGALVVTLATSDPAVDLDAALAQLAEVAVGRVAEGGSSDAGSDQAPPAESTHPEDPCTLFSAEELSAQIGATLTAVPDFESCRWDSADGTSTVTVSFPEGELTTMKTLYPQGEDITVGGQPAYQTDQSFTGLVASQVDVDLGPDTMSLLVTSTNEGLDAATLALELAETAFGNGLQVLPEPEGVVTACGLATPEEIAAAAGLNFALTVQDYEIQCTYEGGKGNKHILIYVAVQDPATFEMAMQGLGGTEIDGPGETSWWLADYGSLASLQGDLAIQVTLTPDKETQRRQAPADGHRHHGGSVGAITASSGQEPLDVARPRRCDSPLEHLAVLATNREAQLLAEVGASRVSRPPRGRPAHGSSGSRSSTSVSEV